ncbi:hypothetical protein HDU83_002295 [Entophlyctis luteolus]|nr:hypothetical protein HDU83_002295 [Entophlyctis luteolus]
MQEGQSELSPVQTANEANDSGTATFPAVSRATSSLVRQTSRISNAITNNGATEEAFTNSSIAHKEAESGLNEKLPIESILNRQPSNSEENEIDDVVPSDLTTNFHSLAEQIELAKAAGLRRKTILVDLKDPDASISHLVNFHSNPDDTVQNSAKVKGNRRLTSGGSEVGLQSHPSATLLQHGTPNDETNTGRISAINPSLTGSSTAIKGASAKRGNSVSFASQSPPSSAKHTPSSVAQRTSSSTSLFRPVSVPHDRPFLGSLVLTPPIPEDNEKGGSGYRRELTGGKSTATKQSSAKGTIGLGSMQMGSRIILKPPAITSSAIQVVNAKTPKGPNLAVLLQARQRCHDRNSDVKAMIGAYDPWPLCWPNANDEHANRAKNGRPLKDQWERGMDERFQSSPKESLGPGSFNPPPRHVGYSPANCTAFKSSVPRFRNNQNANADIGPGLYEVSLDRKISCKPSDPWIKSIGSSLGRMMEIAPHWTVGTDVGLIERFANMNDALPVKTAKQSSIFSHENDSKPVQQQQQGNALHVLYGTMFSREAFLQNLSEMIPQGTLGGNMRTKNSEK